MTNQEAIKELQEDKALYMPEEWIESLDRDTPDGRLITALELAIKALEQEQKTGHWIYTGDYLTEGMLKCSECGEKIDVSESYYNFCPNCGAKMEEGSNKECGSQY